MMKKENEIGKSKRGSLMIFSHFYDLKYFRHSKTLDLVESFRMSVVSLENDPLSVEL